MSAIRLPLTVSCNGIFSGAGVARLAGSAVLDRAIFCLPYLLMSEKEIGPVALVAQSIYNPFGQGRFRSAKAISLPGSRSVGH